MDEANTLINQVTDPNYLYYLLITISCAIIMLLAILCKLRVSKPHKETSNLMPLLGATIAHQIKSPLSTANMYANALKAALSEAHVSEITKHDEKKFMLELDEFGYGVIYEAGNNLYKSTLEELKTTDQLLVFIKSILTATDLGTYDIRKCIEEAKAEYLGKAEDKQIVIKPGSSFNVFGSKHYVKLVLLTLFKNAFDKATSKVEVWFRSNKLHIKDNSHGMAEEELAAIFDRFHTKNYKNIGIELSLCKMIMEDMKGTIEAKSLHGYGTEFILTFPKDPPKAKHKV